MEIREDILGSSYSELDFPEGASEPPCCFWEYYLAEQEPWGGRRFSLDSASCQPPTPGLLVSPAANSAQRKAESDTRPIPKRLPGFLLPFNQNQMHLSAFHQRKPKAL